ncbi:MAG: hypothetical protein ABIM85_06420, partial [candidate division WOR-3 bacterium]
MNLKILKVFSFIVMGLIFQAQVSIKKPDEERITPLAFIEGTRGWAENGTYLWTAVLTYNVGIGTSTPAYKLDVVGASRIQGDLYINSWPISITSAPATGQVLKWNGTAFVPMDDAGVGDCEWLDAGSYLYPRDQSAGEVRIYEDASSAKIYALQTNTSYVSITGAFSNGPFGQLGSSSYGVFGRYVSGGIATNMYGYIGLNIWGVYGNSDNTSGAGVGGFGGTVTSGVYGQTNTSAVEAGVYGVNTNASGTGIIGIGSNVQSILWSGQGDGVVGASDAYGVIGSHYNGVNNNRWGALGTPYNGVYGSSDNASGAGVFGEGGTATTGVYGQTGASTEQGVWGHNSNTSGTGVLGSGNNATAIYPSGGGGVSGSGTNLGVIGWNSSNTNINGILGGQYSGVQGVSNNTSGAGVYGAHTAASSSAIGVYGTCTGGSYDYTCVIGYDPNYSDYYGYGGRFYGGWFGVYGYNGYTGGVGYGVYGYAPSSGYAVYADGRFAASGTKSAIVRTSKGPRELYCVESPEIWFTEVGSGKLINGKAHIELDPLFLETVTIDENNPMKVIITLTDECNGVYVKKGKTGFDVIELNNGKSNATFDYVVYAKRKGYENKRLEFTEAGYVDEHLYPDINDPEIPSKIREKRLNELKTRQLGEKLYESLQQVKAVSVEVKKEKMA